MRNLSRFLLSAICAAVLATCFTVPAFAQTNTSNVLNVLLQHHIRETDNVPVYIFTASNSSYLGKLTKALKYESIDSIESKILTNCIGSWVSGRSPKEVVITFNKSNLNATCSALMSSWLPATQMNKALPYAYLVMDPNFTLSTERQQTPISTLGSSNRLQYIFADLPKIGMLPYRETVGRVCTMLTPAQRTSIIGQMQAIHGTRPLWVVDAWWLRYKTGWYIKTFDSTRSWTGNCAPVTRLSYYMNLLSLNFNDMISNNLNR
ncbi:hypothetical protein KBC70_03835 [Candidatus Woesebacteria bacterium]|nr:hypothetical protein [Candidatus Woesebacteria bacterium]